MPVIMSITAWMTLLITVIAAILLISERLRPDLIALIVMVVLGLSSLVAPDKVFAGFSGSAVMTILGISIISEGLRQSGVTQAIGTFMHRIGRQSETRLILVTLLTSATVSLFMNNIAAVGVLLPAVMALSRKSGVSPSRLLMPLAFGATLGGMATLLTTANIIVSGSLKDAGFKPFGLLDFLPIGAPLVLIGAVYMITLGRKLLSTHVTGLNFDAQPQAPRLANLYKLQNELCLVQLLPDSPLVNTSLKTGRWSQQTHLTIVGCMHDGIPDFNLDPDLPLAAGDILLVHGYPDAGRLAAMGLVIQPRREEELPFADQSTTLAELVVAPHATLIGRTLEQLHFRVRYGLTVLSIWREGSPLQKDIAHTPLHFGDALLAQGAAEKIHLLHDDPDLILMKEDPDAVLRPRKFWLAIIITILTLVIITIGDLHVSQIVLAGAVVMLLSGCLSLNDVYHSVEWKAIFLIAGMWPLSTAITTSGLANSSIHALLNLLGAVSPLLIAVILIGIAMLMTQFMSGQVSALVLAPLALAAAQQSGADPRALCMAVALGCSLAFPTPYGHPVNIMVMNPGGYNFRDFLRVGLPLTVLIFAGIIAGLHFFWGL